jgi:hypothetical protein
VIDYHPGQSALVCQPRCHAERPQVDAFISLYYDDNGINLLGALSNNVWCLSRNDNDPIPLGTGFSIHVLPRR